MEEIEDLKIIKTEQFKHSKIKKNMFKKNQFFIISYTVFGFIILTLGLIALIITWAYPCVHTKCNGNATCYNTPFKADCVCNYGFAGDGRDHCDECGLTYYKHNAEENPLSSIPYSWPATGLLELSYTGFEKINDEKILYYYYSNCGAVLINRRTALTAAHCIKNTVTYLDWYYYQYFTINITFNNFHPNLESIYSLYFGTHDYVYYGAVFPHVQMGDVQDIIIHPNFDPITNQNDIAVIKFANEIELNRYIQIACLPNKTSNDIPRESHKKGYIAGYSSTGGDYLSWEQQNAAMDLYNTSMCKDIHAEKSKNWDIQFCAGEYNAYGNLTGNCHGDYGSPLYVKEMVNEKDKFVATGLLSYDIPCSAQHSPAIFTRISSYVDWIMKNSKY